MGEAVNTKAVSWAMDSASPGTTAVCPPASATVPSVGSAVTVAESWDALKLASPGAWMPSPAATASYATVTLCGEGDAAATPSTTTPEVAGTPARSSAAGLPTKSSMVPPLRLMAVPTAGPPVARSAVDTS